MTESVPAPAPTPARAAWRRRTVGALLAGAVATALSGGSPTLIAKAGIAAEACLRYITDPRAVRNALQGEGFRYEGVSGGQHIFTANFRRIVMATTGPGDPLPRCLVSVQRMTATEAQRLALFWIQTTGGRSETPPHPGTLASWSGSLNGIPMRVAILDEIDFGAMRGAAIVVGRP